MSISRRNFINLSLKSIMVIGAGNVVKTYAASTFRLPAMEDILLRFALVSDGHYGQPGTDFDMHHDNTIGWLNDEHANRGL